MTRGDTTEILAKHDPDYLRHRRRERRWVVGVIVLAILALAGAAYAVASALKTERQVTRIEQLVETPCLEYGSHSRQCEEAFEAAVAAINHREACFVGQKMGIHPKSCEGSHLRSTALPRRSRSSQARPTREEVMPSTPSTGHSPSGPSPGGPTDTPSHPHAPSVPHQSPGGQGGEGPAAGPTAPTVPSSSSPLSSQTTERSTETVVVEPPAPEAPAPVRTAAGVVVEALKPTVEGLGETVGGAVEGVEDTTCELAKVLCSTE